MICGGATGLYPSGSRCYGNLLSNGRANMQRKEEMIAATKAAAVEEKGGIIDGAGADSSAGRQNRTE